jgi:hypothetical protein
MNLGNWDLILWGNLMFGAIFLAGSIRVDPRNLKIALDDLALMMKPLVNPYEPGWSRQLLIQLNPANPVKIDSNAVLYLVLVTTKPVQRSANRLGS